MCRCGDCGEKGCLLGFGGSCNMKKNLRVKVGIIYILIALL